MSSGAQHIIGIIGVS